MLGLLIAAALVAGHKAVRQEREVAGLVQNLADDIRQGLSPVALAARHGDQLAFCPTEVFAGRLAILREARLGPYREALPGQRATLVRRIAELAEPSQPPEWKPVARGETLAQPFTLRPGERLERIDLQWWPRGARWAESLAWTLVEASGDAQRQTVAAGRIDQRDARGLYVKLSVPPAAAGPRHLELVLAPAEQPSGPPAYLPVYRDRSGGMVLRAFLFVSPVGQ
jgi:hypothetical protein